MLLMKENPFLSTALQRQGTTVLDCHLKVPAQPNARCLEESHKANKT